jgi:hypothetical protein
MRTHNSVPLPSFSFFREMPAATSFPVLFLLAATVIIASTPLFQHRYGFYRLDKITLGADTRAESAMRTLASPELTAAALVSGALSELPASIFAISYSKYTVRNGDTVSSILARSGLRNIGSILSANNISNARYIRAGQTLKLPSMDGILYTVSRGDSLSGIAGRVSIPNRFSLYPGPPSRAANCAGPWANFLLFRFAGGSLPVSATGAIPSPTCGASIPESILRLPSGQPSRQRSTER